MTMRRRLPFLSLAAMLFAAAGCQPSTPTAYPGRSTETSTVTAVDSSPELEPAASETPADAPEMPAEPEPSAETQPAAAEAEPAEEMKLDAPAEPTPAPVEPAPAEPAPAPAEPAPAATEAAPMPAEPAPAATEAAPMPAEAAPSPAEAAPAPAAPEPAAAPVEPAPAAPATAMQATPLTVTVPLGLPPLPVPDDNPITVEKVELGKLLYFDNRLSKDGSVSCATCHDPQMAWAEHTPTSKGIGGQMGGANSPTVINAAYAPAQFWDGRAASLEEQALGPIANPIEMGHSLPEMIGTLDQIAVYKDHFQKAFGTGITGDGIGKAIASFERTVLSGNSPYDKFKAGDANALNDAQKEGMALFEDVGCAGCHTPPLFSTYEYVNAGVGMQKEKPDQGRKAVSGNDADLGAFRVPSLREVANTAPYFHDGSTATLADAVALMAKGGIDNPNRSPMLKEVGDLGLSAEDQAKIVEFLKALSGEYPIVAPPALP